METKWLAVYDPNEVIHPQTRAGVISLLGISGGSPGVRVLRRGHPQEGCDPKVEAVVFVKARLSALIIDGQCEWGTSSLVRPIAGDPLSKEWISDGQWTHTDALGVVRDADGHLLRKLRAVKVTP
jgi:hypothetical protein